MLFFVALFLALGSIAVMLGAGHSKAQTIQLDKVAHASVSVALGSSARMLVADPVKAWGLAMVPGLAKEVFDARKGGSGFSWGDLAADAVGAYIGVQLAGLSISRNRVSYTRSF